MTKFREFIKNNQSVMAICAIITLLFAILYYIQLEIDKTDAALEMQVTLINNDLKTNYVTQTRYYSFARANNTDIKANRKVLTEVSKQTYTNTGWIKATSISILPFSPHQQQ